MYDSHMSRNTCNHSLGALSDMETTGLTRDYHYRRCTVCDYQERLPRAGKLHTGYSLKAETKRDFDRREYAKDILQPKDTRGNVSELFQHAWGSPYKKSSVGSQVDKYRIKDGTKKKKQSKTH